jgi:pimeloyl-ACP methyl ester carboxylesterase
MALDPKALSETATRYKSVTIDGLKIAYREAGPKDVPTILLLHGFPTSSHMFRDLIPLLSDCYHLIAPDYPGFGYSAAPRVGEFNYTFDALADLILAFTDALGLKRYMIYLQDFGGPVGFRVAAKRPECVTGLIVQNANAYDEGMSDTIRRLVLSLWPKPTPETEAAARSIFEPSGTKMQFLEGVPDPSLVSPDAWEHAQWGLERDGIKDVAFALHANYGSNVLLYPSWHEYFRQYHPRTLVVWGKGDHIFTVAGAEAYRKDLPKAEVYILDTGHFALETHAPLIAWHIVDFFARNY